MYDGKSAADDSGNSGSSSLPSENRAHEPGGVQQPPPYSQVASSSQFSNQPMQQQQMWNPQAAQGYPPFPHPGAHQQQPFQHGVYPPQAGVIQGRQESAIRHGIASNVMVIGRTYRRRSCTYRLTRLGITLFLIGVILLIMLGVLVIRPTLNDTRLRSTRCTVISSKYTDKYISCDCGRYCTSHYPCLQIQVSYSAKGKRQTGYLYEDVYADKNKCSVQSCSSYEQSNYDDVRGFDLSYGTVDQSYTCYYNPKTPDEVFKYHSSASSDHMKIMHCILWPLVIMMLSAFMLGVLFCRSKGHCCFKKGGSSVPYQDLEPRA